MTTYDVAIIGGGHNGLVCAAYLAREGKRVVVLESRDIVGGFCTTEETIPDAPGFKMNATSMDHVVTNISPSVVDELGLDRFGLQWIVPDPFYSYLSPDGATIRFWRDHTRTVEEIRKLSRKDALRYDRFTTTMRDFWQTASPYLMGHPRRIAPRTLAELAKRGFKARKSLGTAARILLASPGSVIEEWFEREELKAALGCYSVASMGSLDEPGTGIVLSVMAVMHHWGARRPVGGNGVFADALEACVRHHGGEVRTASPVAEVLLEGGRATGVVTLAGEAVRATQVVAAVDPWTLMNRLVPAAAVPEIVRDELRGMSVLHNNISGFKGDVALSRRPSLARHGAGGRGVPENDDDALLGSVILMAPDIDYVRRSLAGTMRGELAAEIPLWISTPTVYDRSLVPPGSEGDSLYVYLPAVPYELRDSDWAVEKDKHLERCLQIFEDYAPGVGESVIGAHATSPQDLANFSPVHKGNLFHVDMTLSQFGPWRPIPSLAGYRTPIDGLWHTGAGAHPLGTLNGWSGRTTARELLRGSA
ncbi:MAG: phytoene desaturase family protein [Acidimicrobiia bacterium]